MDRLNRILAPLPRMLRDEIRGYAETVAQALPEIFARANVRDSPALRDTFVFFAGVRRLWTLVDTQYWILSNSLEMMRDARVQAVQIGSATYSHRTDNYRQVAELRRKLRRQLVRLEAFEYASASSLTDLAQALDSQA